MNATAITILLLVISNVFMTIAWYGHLKMQSMGIGKDWPLFVVILFSWGIGGPFSLMQLKVLQEVITLTVFTVLAMFFFSGEKLHWNHIAAFVCLVAAVYFVFMPSK